MNALTLADCFKTSKLHITVKTCAAPFFCFRIFSPTKMNTPQQSRDTARGQSLGQSPTHVSGQPQRIVRIPFPPRVPPMRRAQTNNTTTRRPSATAPPHHPPATAPLAAPATSSQTQAQAPSPPPLASQASLRSSPRVNTITSQPWSLESSQVAILASLDQLLQEYKSGQATQASILHELQRMNGSNDSQIRDNQLEILAAVRALKPSADDERANLATTGIMSAVGVLALDFTAMFSRPEGSKTLALLRLSASFGLCAVGLSAWIFFSGTKEVGRAAQAKDR
ncbi:uncharacterized protein FSUBG_8407 [Fusarium subglutinans]|uniref:Transmembrane protein n=1 Tax=Gibberella subglutinans TaxID=42677 RepID=A0A8H5PIQ7_GIBSU|nr:uncharacterized protein FSUBG_8407 [Fusarium subglutinans]KAF5597685.1 hypothetical protein FSUBG_8407 [Fusarium subglutinans]